jgi:hypothetical protein
MKNRYSIFKGVGYDQENGQPYGPYVFSYNLDSKLPLQQVFEKEKKRFPHTPLRIYFDHNNNCMEG